MITEDYVSFETAKLLKEKGFDGECDLFGRTDESELIIREASKIAYNQGIDNECIVLPTQAMAMKWLREVHNIAINIGWGEVFEDKFQWWCIILNQKDGSILRDSEYSSTYEQACESAVRYCLETIN